MSSYALVGNVWPAGTTTITYSFATASVNGNPLTSEITNPAQRAAITAAFAQWTKLTGIKFVAEPDGSVSNIRLGYANNLAVVPVLGLTTLSYGNNGIIDPTSSYIRLQDPAYTPLATDSSGQLYYSTNTNEAVDVTLEQLAIHEIGHVLGFADNLDPDSIEDKLLTSENRTFDATDLAGAQYLYPATAAASLPGTVITPTAAPVAPTLFTLVDNSHGNATTAITADSYNGPLSFLSHGDAFSYNGSDNVQVSAGAATNPLIATGSGNDLLTSAATGSSVLDAGTGANIETDGGNGNTTFVQNGYVGGTTWDFLQNVHGGDTDIMFGYILGVSTISVLASGGLGSAKGATVVIHPGNGNTEEVTFVGLSASQIHGCSANIDGVPSWYMWVS